MKGRAILYSADELAWIEARKEEPRRALHRKFCETFNRSDISADAFKALCTRKGWKTGRTGCFANGQEPANKGKKCEPGKGGLHPNARKTQFKKGGEPHNTHYLGHERIDPKDGYVYVSIDEPNPHTGYSRRYVLKHRHEWEKANGPVPEGHALKCLDGDRTNCAPANWEAVPRALLPRLAGGNRYHRKLAFDDAPAELKPTILAIAKVEHAAKKRKAA